MVKDWLEAVDLLPLQRPIVARASEPFPTLLGRLDALHLATALVGSDRMEQELVMAPHDGGPATAARAFGTEVIGSEPEGRADRSKPARLLSPGDGRDVALSRVVDMPAGWSDSGVPAL